MDRNGEGGKGGGGEGGQKLKKGNEIKRWEGGLWRFVILCTDQKFQTKSSGTNSGKEALLLIRKGGERSI